MIGLGHSLPFTVTSLLLLYISTSCWNNKVNSILNHCSEEKSYSYTEYPKDDILLDIETYHCFPCDFRMLLVEVLLKLWELIKVPVLFTQSLTGVAEFALRWPISTATETGRATISV